MSATLTNFKNKLNFLEIFFLFLAKLNESRFIFIERKDKNPKLKIIILRKVKVFKILWKLPI